MGVFGKEHGLRGKEECLAHCLSCLEDDEDQKVCVEFRVFCNCRYSGLAGSGVS